MERVHVLCRYMCVWLCVCIHEHYMHMRARMRELEYARRGLADSSVQTCENEQCIQSSVRDARARMCFNYDTHI